MAIEHQRPTFSVVLQDGDQWTVEAEWPDGTIEQAAAVESEAAGFFWLRELSEAWIKNRGG
jgi:hypothetical protein